jgi:hypothetical protein
VDARELHRGDGRRDPPPGRRSRREDWLRRPRHLAPSAAAWTRPSPPRSSIGRWAIG